MIAIPNMSKPKSCKECELFYIEFYMGENKMGSACTLNDDDGSTIEADYNSCPLIEIDENDPMLLEFLNEFDKWRAYKELMDSIRTAQKKGEANDIR